MVVRAIDQHAALQRFLHERRAFDRKIDSQDQSFAANFADEIEARGKLFNPRAELAPRSRTFARRSSSSTTLEIRAPRRTPVVRRRMWSHASPDENADANFSLARIAPRGNPPARGLAIDTMSGSDRRISDKRSSGRCGPGRFESHRRSMRRRSAWPASARASRIPSLTGKYRLRLASARSPRRRPFRRISLRGRATSLKRTNSTPGTSGSNGSRYFVGWVIESAPNVRP